MALLDRVSYIRRSALLEARLAFSTKPREHLREGWTAISISHWRSIPIASRRCSPWRALRELVEMRLGTKVDIGLRRDLRPHVAQAFERDAVRVLTRSLAEGLADLLEAAGDLIDIAGAMDDGAFHALPNADRKLN